VEGYRRVVDLRPRMKVFLLEKVLTLEHRMKNVEGVIRTLKQLVVARPSNPDYPSQLAYYRLLTGTELELAWTTPAQESARMPLSLLRVLTSLTQNHATTDVTPLHELQSVDQLDAGVRAVIAGLWALGKEEGKAYRMAEAVPASLLLPMEAKYRQIALGQ
jgi:hypothetical protein